MTNRLVSFLVIVCKMEAQERLLRATAVLCDALRKYNKERYEQFSCFLRTNQYKTTETCFYLCKSRASIFTGLEVSKSKKIMSQNFDLINKPICKRCYTGI